MSHTPRLCTPLEREPGVKVSWVLEPDGLPSVTVSSDEASWGLFLTFAELREFVANAETLLLWAAQRGETPRDDATGTVGAAAQRTRLRHGDGTAVDVLLPCSVETFAKVCGALGKIGFDLLRVDNPAPEVMCACGHTARWHSHGGVGDCEHDADCRCERLTEPGGDDGSR